ncbi:MAG: hypothetical protein WBH94_01910 [Methanoculleus sp.]
MANVIPIIASPPILALIADAGAGKARLSNAHDDHETSRSGDR